MNIVRRGLEEFGRLDIIFTAGTWNGYTKEAKDFCVAQKVGLFNSEEINGALWADKFWDYVQKDQDGNPRYKYKAA